MVFQEPKVEFVPIKLSEVIYTSPNTGGGQYCIASQEDSQYCANWVGDIDWDAPQPGT